MAKYVLQCCHPDCGRIYADDTNYRLACDAELAGEHGPAFLRAVFPRQQIQVHMDLPGIFIYHDWLPVGDAYLSPPAADLGRPLCYRSTGLARHLGLSELFIAFSGYWPERGGNLLTRSFKEFEAQATFARYLGTYADREAAPFIVSSAGNTANGFNLISHQLGLPLYLVIPETGLDTLLLPIPNAPLLVVVRGDYLDAIKLADAVADRTGLMREGGARNVARRAGMGTVMLNAVAHPHQGRGRIFDHYFQAVGSGTGAIAAWEATRLLRADGRFGDATTQIHIAQNSPFTPIVDAWEDGSDTIAEEDEVCAKRKISSVAAPVLTNRHPPYSPAGGMRDVLRESGGAAWRVDNRHLFAAARMFRETEGVDIGPAGAVAVNALCQALSAARIGTDDAILLHITGGGQEIQYSGGATYPAKPSLHVEPGQVETVVKAIGQIARIAPGIKCVKKWAGTQGDTD